MRGRNTKRLVTCASLVLAALPCEAQNTNRMRGHCQIEAGTFRGWTAQKLTNEWVQLMIVPQLGGRVMQVSFAGHPYLFINPKYEGQYISSNGEAAEGRWINYGGDKIWPMPEGTQDEQHWAGPVSDALDDGEYSFKVLSQDSTCTVRLEGPPDPKTGLQYAREISIGTHSPEISFHAVMKNITGHPIRWSMQSVTQYDTSDAAKPGEFNRDFWAFTLANHRSAYLNRYHVRTGLANDPSFSVNDDLFQLHWLNLQSEVWVDSPGGWLAVVDRSAGYAMVERFPYFKADEYPGNATVIFYKNGPSLELNDKGIPYVTASNPEDALHYMEAEVNSPMVRLEPGETYALDTKWLPTRMGREFKTVTDAGVVGNSFSVSPTPSGILLSGVFGVFTPGKLQARLFDKQGVAIASVVLQSVGPLAVVELHEEIKVPRQTARVSLHVMDQQGIDLGSLGEGWVSAADGGS